jgi:hypothetical protein
MRRNNRITFNGRTMCIADWAVATGMCFDTLYARLFTMRWDAARALTTPVQKRRRGLTAKGEFLPIAEWSRRTGIKETTITQRIAYGWSIEKALGFA